VATQPSDETADGLAIPHDVHETGSWLEDQYLVQQFRSDKLFIFGLILIAILVIMAIFPGLIAPYDPTAADPFSILQAPSSHHLLGTDVNGMDVFSRIVWAPRIDLLVAIVSVTISFAIGVPLGAWLGYFSGMRNLGGWLEQGVMRTLDVFQAFPVFVLALAIMAVLGRTVGNVILVIALLDIPIFVRLTRSAVLSIRSKAFVEAARCTGNSDFKIIWRHILPNSLSPALINASVLTGAAMIITAGLSFIGAGVPAPTAEWGYMVAVGAPNMIEGQWWPGLFPGAALGIAVLAFALVSDGLRSYLDPTRRDS
jgi:peptide/nickel transport system permease protein